MSIKERYEELWGDFSPQLDDDMCSYAAQFANWAEALLRSIENDTGGREPHIVAVNQAKILLCDKYFAYRNAVPKAHRNRVSKEGHICIFHVFEGGYNRLQVIELSLTPPMIFVPAVPAPPSPKPPAQIAGIFMGALDDE